MSNLCVSSHCGRPDTRPQREADKLKRKKNREVKGARRYATVPVCLADFVPSYARKSRPFPRCLGGAEHTDLSLAKQRAENQRSRNNFNYTTLLRLLNENGPHGDLSFSSISFRPSGQSWKNSTSSSSPTRKPRHQPAMAYFPPPPPLRYWVLRCQNYSGRGGKLTLLK